MKFMLAIVVAFVLTTAAQAGDLAKALMGGDLLQAMSMIDATAEATAPAPDPQLGPRWTYPGDIYEHLRGSNHAHDTRGIDLSKLTRQQAEDLHSDLHNAEQLQIKLTHAVPTAASRCPDGVCPTYVRQPVQRVAGAATGAVVRTVRVASMRVRSRPVRGFVRRLFARRRRCR